MNNEIIRPVYIPTAEQAAIVSENNNENIRKELENISDSIITEAKKGSTFVHYKVSVNLEHIAKVLEAFGYRVEISGNEIRIVW